MILSIKTKLCGWEGIGPSEEAPGGVLLNGHGSHEMSSKSRCLIYPDCFCFSPGLGSLFLQRDAVTADAWVQENSNGYGGVAAWCSTLKERKESDLSHSL